MMKSKAFKLLGMNALLFIIAPVANRNAG
jgi:hypothetical protein